MPAFLEPSRLFATVGLSSIILVLLIAAIVVVALRIVRSSIVYIPNTQYGIVERKWSLRPHRERYGLIALEGGAGFLPHTLRGGWHFLIPFQYRVYKRALIRVDQIAYLIARVGEPLRHGQALAQWPAAPVAADGGSPAVDVENARAFLTGGGQRGSQRLIVRSGTYAINTALFCVITEDEILNIEGQPTPDDEGLQQLIRQRGGFQPIIIGNDNIGIVTVQDGPSLAHGEIVAPSVGVDPARENFHDSFQDITGFLAAGGRKGRQEQVLVEGTYYINALFALVEVREKTKIGIGTVGVVNSYVGPEVVDALTADGGRGRTVENGKRGIWSKPLEPGKYALNPYALEITVVPTTNFQLRWISGVTTKLKDARLESNRVSFDDELKEIEVITKDAYNILLPISVVAHIAPAAAPHVIQRFSQVSRFVNQTLDPMIASWFRDAAQGCTLLEFIQGRAELGKTALQVIKARLAEHRIEIEEIMIGTPVAPAGDTSMEGLLDQLRQRQMAAEQKTTLEAQGAAADQQKLLNEKVAVAEMQTNLSRSHVGIQVAENEGQAEASRAARAASAILARAEAEAKGTRLRGEAEAAASKSKLDAMGGTETYIQQFTVQNLVEALRDAKQPIVPSMVVMGGGENARTGSPLLDALLAMVLRSEAANKLGR